MAAFVRFTRPGSASCNGTRRPSGQHDVIAVEVHVGIGVERGRTTRQFQSSAANVSRPPHAGHPTASPRHDEPAATQIGFGAGIAAHATSGSSALATTSGGGSVTIASRQRAARSAHLVAAIELVAAQVQQHDGVGRGRGHHVPEPTFVDFENGGGVGVGPAERGHVTRRHVRTHGVRHHGADRRQRAATSKRVVVVLPFVALTSATSRPRAQLAQEVAVDE